MHEQQMLEVEEEDHVLKATYEDTNNRRNDLTKTEAMVDLEEIAIEEEKDNLLIKPSSSVSIFITSSISSMNALIERRRPIMLRLMMKEILLM